MKTTTFVGWLVVVAVAIAACATPPTGTAPEEDFGFTLADTVLATTPGTSVTTGATIIPVNGFSGTVSLGLVEQDGSPADPGITIAPAGIAVARADIGASSVQRQIEFGVGPAVPDGAYDLRVVATSGDLSSTSDLTLTVAADLTPLVVIATPSDGTTVIGDRTVQLSGTLSSLDPIVAVDVLGGADLVSLQFDQDAFSATVELENNANSVSVSATSSAGRVGVSDAVTVNYPFLDIENFAAADVVIGQPDFISSDSNQGGAAAADTMNLPLGPVFVTAAGRVFISDSRNHRLLGFDQVPTANGAAADFVVGQPDFTTDTFGTSATTFRTPGSVHSDGTRFAVADIENDRVLLWNSVPTGQDPADVVVGQSDFVSADFGCAADRLDNPEFAILVDGKLVVADFLNHRVLIWNAIPTSNGEPADLVLGQDSFTTCAGNDDDQNGADDGAPTARTLQFPSSLWSDGTRLVVADPSNQRILIWNTFPTSDFAPADLVVGQPDFTTNIPGSTAASFSGPRQVFVTVNDQLLVADEISHRVVVFDRFPTANGQAADRVIGQSTFTHSTANDDDQDGVLDGAPSARTFNLPLGVFMTDEALFLTDVLNNRVSIFSRP
jgi:hypothetical protein